MDYYAIEGSATIVDQLHKRYPELSSSILVGDFTLDAPFDGSFDLVIDRGSLTCNTSGSIKAALSNVYAMLRPGGIFIGSDWFSTNHTLYSQGEASDDLYTRSNYVRGHVAGIGRVHFSNQAHLCDLFSKFKILFLEEKLSKTFLPADNQQLAFWNIVAKRPLLQEYSE